MVAVKDAAKKRSSRSSRAALCARMRAKKAALSQAQETPPTCQQTMPLPDQLPPAPSASACKLHASASSPVDSVSMRYVIVDLTQLAFLFSPFRCSICGGKLELTSNASSRRGFAHHLSVRCLDCAHKEASTCTSTQIGNGSSHFEVNRKMVFAFLNVGVGFGGLSTFCETMGMEGMTEKTHASHVLAIHGSSLAYKEDMLAEAGKRVREAHDKTSGTLDLAVSFDSSWQKQGHTSKHGIGAVIETSTGLVLDFHVMATFCQLCASVGKKKMAVGQEAYDQWYATHKERCTVNNVGSSGMMEVEASRVLWGRSLERGFRYATLISNGDSKMFNELLKLDPYPGLEIKKEECTNHVAKRLRTGLRNLVSTEAKKGNTLGGRKTGSLSKQKMRLLQSYYKKAVASKCQTTEELPRKIMRTCLHACSTDDTPQHQDCPKRKESWCFHQRAIAYGRPPLPHSGKSSCFLNANVGRSVRAVYERLTTDSLLSRCLLGMTQNANE